MTISASGARCLALGECPRSAPPAPRRTLPRLWRSQARTRLHVAVDSASKGPINISILHSGSKAQDKGYSENHDLWNPCVYVAVLAACIVYIHGPQRADHIITFGAYVCTPKRLPGAIHNGVIRIYIYVYIYGSWSLGR